MGDKNRCEAQRSAIRRFDEYVAGESFMGASLTELIERARLLEKAYARYTDEHLKVVQTLTGEEELDVQLKIAGATADMFEKTLIRIKERVSELKTFEREAHEREARELEAHAREGRALSIQEQGEAPRDAPRAMTSSDVRLERIKPMIFSGDYSQWHEWRSLYESLVHDNDALSAIQKFHYLKQSIDGAAANVISGWHTTSENYGVAYEALVGVFDNKYRIIMAYLDELVSIPNQTSESHTGLRQLIDTINRVVRQLKVIGCPVEHWDNFIVHILLTRMAVSSLEEWENSHDSSEMPTMAQVVKFLERRARGKLNTACSANVAVQHVQVNASQPATAPSKGAKTGSTTPKPIKCHLCSQPHPIFRCTQFIKLPIEERRSKARDLKLCFNCLAPGHRANTPACRFGTCQRCNKNQHHNSLLCLEAVSATVNLVATEQNGGNVEQDETKQNF